MNKPIIFLPRSKSRVRKLLSFFIPTCFWFTYRLPFQNHVTITYPDEIKNHMDSIYLSIRMHEHIHCEQMDSAFGLFKTILFYTVFPLPIFFSGRYFIERPAYLIDIRSGAKTIDDTVNTLWKHYLYPWPRKWMKTWFLINK